MDLSKAFDSLDHQILINKLKKCGFQNAELNWFRNYLTNRLQYITYNNKSSSYKKITTGVPQGSILGPLLFLIYVNDLPLHTELNIIQYADDTSILIPYRYNSDQAKTIENSLKINEELHKIYTLLVSNK